MKYCPKCSKQFSDSENICPHDDSRLVDGKVVKQYELMGKIFGGAMSSMLGTEGNIDGFFDFDKLSWEGLADKADDVRVDRYQLIAPVIFCCANQSALHFYDDCIKDDSRNHIESLIEFVSLYVVILKRTVLSKTGSSFGALSAWPKFLNSLKHEFVTNLNLDEAQSKEFWSMFNGYLRQREAKYKNCSLIYKRSWDDSSNDIFSTFGRLASSRWRLKEKKESTVPINVRTASSAITAAVIGLNIAPKMMDAFMSTAPLFPDDLSKDD